MVHNRFNKFIVFLTILLLFLNLCSCKTIEVDVHMFSSIEECQNIKSLKSNNVEIYDFPTGDKYLKKLKFEEWFGCKYNSDDLTFELFAYVFSSNEHAMNYFQNVTGKVNDPNPTFLSSAGMSSYSRIVVSENKAYVVYCKKNAKENVIKFINSWFSVDITNDIGKGKNTGDSSVS